MAVKKRKIINRRQLKVAEIWERDPTQNQEDIARILLDEFGIKASQPTVSRDLKAIDQRIQAKSEAVILAMKDTLLAEYEAIYTEAFAAWLRSLEDKETKTFENVERGLTDAISRIKAQERTEGQSGNPGLLAQAQAALKAIREMYGIDEAQKVQHTGGLEITYTNDWRTQPEDDQATVPPPGSADGQAEG